MKSRVHSDASCTKSRRCRDISRQNGFVVDVHLLFLHGPGLKLSMLREKQAIYKTEVIVVRVKPPSTRTVLHCTSICTPASTKYSSQFARIPFYVVVNLFRAHSFKRISRLGATRCLHRTM